MSTVRIGDPTPTPTVKSRADVINCKCSRSLMRFEFSKDDPINQGIILRIVNDIFVRADLANNGHVIIVSNFQTRKLFLICWPLTPLRS